MDDAALIAGFEAGTLEQFPHEDHLRVVFGLVVRQGRAAALEQVSAGILRMATAKGAPRSST